MRIQFVRVPAAGTFGESSEKVLMCVSELKEKIDPKDFDDYMQKRLGVAGVLITDEVVRFEQAQPEPEPERSAPDVQPLPVSYMCMRAGRSVVPSPGSEHGPCEYIACCLDHCRCEHTPDASVRVRCDRCADRTGPAALCDHD